MADLDARLDKMIEIADRTGETLDDVVKAVGRLDQSAFERVAERPSLLPLYMKSKVSP